MVEAGAISALRISRDDDDCGAMDFTESQLSLNGQAARILLYHGSPPFQGSASHKSAQMPLFIAKLN